MKININRQNKKSTRAAFKQQSLFPFFFTFLFSLLIFSCLDPFTGTPFEKLPEGYGSFSLRVENPRTIIPTVPSTFAAYTLEFTATNGGETILPVDRTSANLTDAVMLKAGTYSLTVYAYLDSGKTRLTAQGTLTDILISSGVQASGVVPLKALSTNEGSGMFSWSITISASGVTSATMAITKGGSPINGSPITLNLSGVTAGTPTLSSGVYNIAITLRKEENNIVKEEAVWYEMLYIYNELTSSFSPTFSDQFFYTTRYTVTFVYNDEGATSNGTQSVEHGDDTLTEPTPTRDGYRFDGWYTDNNIFINRYDFSTAVYGKLTLYAKWTIVPPGFSAVSAGLSHTVAIKSDGTLWAWGYNGSGELGIGTTDYNPHPNPVQIGTDIWASVSAGSSHTMAIKTDGTLWAWGSNSFGKLGDGTTYLRNSPVQIGSGTDWASVSVGDSHSVARKSDGTLWAWGSNGMGQLGIGTTDNNSHPNPVQIGTDTNWASVSAGGNHTVARKSDGTLWVWGYNDKGQLGDSTKTNRSSPVQIGTDIWASVSAGSSHTMAIKTDGTLWAWGETTLGSLGTYPSTSPVQIGTDTNWASVSTGMHTVATKSDGTLWAWGYNSSGQLGNGTTTVSSSPVQIGSGTDWASVSVGYEHSVARKSDGTLWAWGHNSSGELGIGTTTSCSSPVKVMP